MTTVNTIGAAGGRDFSTIPAWVSHIQSITGGTLADEYQGQCYNDSSSANIGGGTAALSISGFSGASASHFMHLMTATGQSAFDTANPLTYDKTKGVWAENKNVTSSGGFLIGTDYTVVEGLQIVSTTGYTGPTIVLSTNLSNVVINRNLLQSNTGTATSNSGVAFMRSGTLKNNLIILNNASGIGVGGFAACDIDSNTLVVPSSVTATAGQGLGVSNYNGTSTVKNNLECGFFGNSGGGATFNYCASTKTITGGTGNISGITFGNQFISTSADFRLKSGADAINVGNTSLTVDIFGTTRPQQTNPCMGCFEYTPAGVAFSAFIDNAQNQPPWSRPKPLAYDTL